MKSLEEIIKENKEANEIKTDAQIPYCVYDKNKKTLYIGVF